uniref:Pentatricopeptide repeat-containing protein n=1 Tax=Ananas comosus var. bracteatus TaxID=296719 RepID=A0A6V7NJM9_ANACO|nr:unnamed protein product [Ananas comosus var. bracteatus]
MPGARARLLSFPLDPRRIKPILALAIPSAAAACSALPAPSPSPPPLPSPRPPTLLPNAPLLPLPRPLFPHLPPPLLRLLIPLLALALHALALRRGLLPHPHVATSLLHSSSSPGLLPRALQLFDEMPRSTAVSFNALLSRLASLDSARRVFDRAMPVRDASAWTAMIAAHARSEDAVHLFDEVVGREKLSPDSLTFTCALHACAHSGMAERGLKLFDEMPIVYGIKPRMEHYGAIVDLLGRAGRIEGAERVV